MMENVLGAKLKAAVEFQSLTKNERALMDPVEGPKIKMIRAMAPSTE